MKTILLWDQRFPDRPPHRMTVNDTLASAAVRSGFAAPIDPADFATLNVGGPLDPGTPTEIALEDGVSKRMRRIAVPASVAAVAVSLGVGASVGKPIGATPTPTPTPTPTLTVTPTSASIPSNTASGYQLFAIGNVPAGVTPTISPNDGRFVIAGNAGTGWVGVVGLSALSAGAVNISVSASGATSAAFALNITAASSVTFRFPALQAKIAAGQRATIAFGPSDSAVAGWGDGLDTGTGTNAQNTAGTAPDNYQRRRAWPYLFKNKAVAAGFKARADAYFSCESSNIANMQAANPNIVCGAGWTLSNFSLSGGILTCANTVSTSTVFYPEETTDALDIVHSANGGLGNIVLSDEDGWTQTIVCGSTAGAQVTNSAGTLGLKRTTVSRPTASKKPITITRGGTGGIFIEAIIPYDTTSPMLEIWNMGWPGSKAYGTSGTGHWNIYSDPTTMTAATPYNALGTLNADAYIIELGTNDQNQGVTPAQLQEAMTNITTKLKGQVGGNGQNIALVKPRIATSGGYNMSADMLAVLDATTAAQGLNTVIDFNSIPFTANPDRFDGTHLTLAGYTKEMEKAWAWITS